MNNILVLGPSYSGKTTFINTLFKIKNKVTTTIGIDLYLYNISNTKKIYFWDVGNGLYYDKILKSLIPKINILIIIQNNKSINFIYDCILFISKYDIKNVIIIFNKIKKYNNNNERYIKYLNYNIKFKFFYIDCNKYKEVIDIFNYINNNIIIMYNDRL